MNLVVGTAQDALLSPRPCTSGFLRTYRFTEDGMGMELLHKVKSYLSEYFILLTPRDRRYPPCCHGIPRTSGCWRWKGSP